jgi:condensin complex subunit 2
MHSLHVVRFCRQLCRLSNDQQRLTFLGPNQDGNASRLPTPPPSAAEPQDIDPPKDDRSLKFTNVMTGLQTVYPKKALNDISTSYCFICLLHLANEKGLVITKTPELTELDIRKDWTADLSVASD